MKDAIKNNDAKTIYKYFGIDAKEDKDGYLTISEYNQPSCDYTFKALGINENKLFEKVKQIKGYANFYNSQITNLGNLKSIDGDADFCGSKITNLNKIETIDGNAWLCFSNITSLGKLKSIGRDVKFTWSKVTDLGNLVYIGGEADIRYSKLKDKDFAHIRVGEGILE